MRLANSKNPIVTRLAHSKNPIGMRLVNSKNPIGMRKNGSSRQRKGRGSGAMKKFFTGKRYPRKTGIFHAFTCDTMGASIKEEGFFCQNNHFSIAGFD